MKFYHENCIQVQENLEDQQKEVVPDKLINFVTKAKIKLQAESLFIVQALLHLNKMTKNLSN